MIAHSASPVHRQANAAFSKIRPSLLVCRCCILQRIHATTEIHAVEGSPMVHWTVSFLMLGILAIGAPAQTSATFTNTLMPEPAHLSLGTGHLQLTPSFTAVSDRFHDARLDDAIGRALVRLGSQTGLQMGTASSHGSAGTLTVTVDGPGETVQSLDENETYSLDVTPNGAHLQAPTDV